MASSNIVVNTDLREWLDPWNFGVRRDWCNSVDEHGANPLYYAIAYLCTGRNNQSRPFNMVGRWQGCEVIYPERRDEMRNGMDHGVLIDPPEHGNLFNFAEATFKNISKDVLREIAVSEPMLLVSMFRKAVSKCEKHSWEIDGETILALYDEATDEGEWLREHLVLAAINELEWTRHQWDLLIVRLRECHAKATAEWPIPRRTRPT